MTLVAISQPPLIDTLITWHLKDMAKFADKVCRTMVLNRESFTDLVLIQDAEVDFSEYNARSLGNLSYIAFYSGQTHYKAAAMKLIERFKKYREDENTANKISRSL